MREFVVTDVADQQFAAVLNGRRLTLRLWWNHEDGHWSVSVFEGTTPLAAGRRIVPGINLVRRYALGIGAIFARGEPEGRDAFTSGALRLYHAAPSEL